MGILIDASVLIDYERGRIDVGRHIAGREKELFFISAITASELLHGVWRAQTVAVRERRSAFVEAIIEKFPILPVELATARIHAQIWADLETRGVMIGPHDCWLAAAAVAGGHTLVTSNLREFARVDSLLVECWA